MASVSGSSTLSADSSASHKSDVWQYLQKTKNARRPSVSYVLRSSRFIATQQICVSTSWIGTVAPTRVMVWKKRSREFIKRSQGQSALLREPS